MMRNTTKFIATYPTDKFVYETLGNSVMYTIS